MGEEKKTNEETKSDKRVHLRCKELEDATNRFLAKIEELEKLLPKVDE